MYSQQQQDACVGEAENVSEGVQGFSSFEPKDTSPAGGTGNTLFKKRSFEDYWFKTGTPTFLLKKIKEQQYFNTSELQVSRNIFDNYSLENIETRSLLFQTGYLTINSIDHRLKLYTLGYPNREVEEAMNNYLIGVLLKRHSNNSLRPVVQLEESFLKNDPAGVVAVILSLLKDMPSHLLDGKGEHFYHAFVHLHFRYLSFFIQSEVHTSDGRLDAVVHTPAHVYILEFKIDLSAEAALRRIDEKGYAGKYLIEKKPIVGIGINFDTVKRGVSDWKAVEIGK